MNRKYLAILLTVLLWTGNVRAQIQDDVLAALESRNFTAFKEFSDSLSNREKGIRSYWELLRDLTPDFREGVFIVEKTVPDEHNPNISSTSLFRVKILAGKTQIVFYELSEQKYRKVADQWESVDETIAGFEDTLLIEELNYSFRALFRADLDEKDLFSNELVYGEHCGFAGTYPEGRYEIMQFVKSGNKEELLKWLRSANSEKQVYAVDGLYQLCKKGAKLTEEELRMIAFVMHKNGRIQVCHGCIHSKDDIKVILAKFNF